MLFKIIYKFRNLN